MAKAKQVGERIAQARREKGVRERRDVKPVDVARAVGVSGAAVSDWEAGKSYPREDLLAKLADYLEVTPAFLRYGIPMKHPRPALPDPERDRKLTPAETDAARRMRDEKTPPQKGRRNG